jgi:type IV pilus assembly protein PilA
MPVRDTRSNPNRPVAKASGFSLLELLIVVAIILIIAAIALPNFLRAKIAANEAAAASEVRTITTAAVEYNSTYANGFPPSLSVLGPPAGGGNTASCDNANLIDEVVAAGQKSGFNFAISGVGDANTTAATGCSLPGFGDYLVTAAPVSIGMTGQRSFCSDEPGEVYFDSTGAVSTNATACENLPVLQ